MAGHQVLVYDIEKSVCDAVRFRNKVGLDVMSEILKGYLSRKERNITRLMDYARKLRVGSAMQEYLTVML